MDEGDYEVGYRKPPLKNRFPKGASGNPTGKRKARPSLSDLLDRILAETVEATEGGVKRRYTKEEVFLRQLIAKAIGGDRPFGRLLMEYLQRRQQASPGNAASHTDDYLMSELEAILRDGKRK